MALTCFRGQPTRLEQYGYLSPKPKPAVRISKILHMGIMLDSLKHVTGLAKDLPICFP